LAKKRTFQIQVVSGRTMPELAGGAQIFDLPLRNLQSPFSLGFKGCAENGWDTTALPADSRGVFGRDM